MLRTMSALDFRQSSGSALSWSVVKAREGPLSRSSTSFWRPTGKVTAPPPVPPVPSRPAPERATSGQRAVRLAALVDGIACKDGLPGSPRKEHWFDNVGQVLHRRSTAHMVLKRVIGSPELQKVPKSTSPAPARRTIHRQRTTDYSRSLH